MWSGGEQSFDVVEAEGLFQVILKCVLPIVTDWLCAVIFNTDWLVNPSLSCVE